MTMYTIDMLEAAHRHSARHREAIETSKFCGCFYCERTFEPSEIEFWVDSEQTAICPKCSIDSVLGDRSGLPVTAAAFLKAMHERWFETRKSWVVS
jgi:hypothetical protein